MGLLWVPIYRNLAQLGPFGSQACLTAAQRVTFDAPQQPKGSLLSGLGTYFGDLLDGFPVHLMHSSRRLRVPGSSLVIEDEVDLQMRISFNADVLHLFLDCCVVEAARSAAEDHWCLKSALSCVGAAG